MNTTLARSFSDSDLYRHILSDKETPRTHAKRSPPEGKLDSYSGNAADEPAYVLDGFPRNLEQALHFESHGTELSKVIYLRASDETLTKRMEQRSNDSGHEDEVSAEQRAVKLRGFKRATLPVIEYYKALGKLVEVDANQAPERVLAYVENVVRK